MPRHTFARIDEQALVHNYRLASRLAGDARAMAVVKADGYGHGIGRVARALVDEAPCFAVACIEEAEALRGAGITHPIVLLEGAHSAEDTRRCALAGFSPVLHSGYQVDWLLSSGHNVPAFWVKVNTGMNRLGFRPEELPAVMERIQSAPGIGSVFSGFMTHFACADEMGSDSTERQRDVFVSAVADWPGEALSAANSAAHFRKGQSLFQWTRPGIMLYGASPMSNQTGLELGLVPVMTLESELIAVRTLRPGESVGYGETWQAQKTTPMGIVAIGYGDGYPRHAGTGTPAFINGQRVQLIGRVSMDMLAVDLSTVPDARPGDRVELWGANVSVDEVARHAGTIGYELLTGVTARVPRV
jgi:alanine racemase